MRPPILDVPRRHARDRSRHCGHVLDDIEVLLTFCPPIGQTLLAGLAVAFTEYRFMSHEPK